MPGPAPLPTKLKILKGVKPFRINKNEPKPKAVSSNIPSGWSRWMSDGAKRFWKRYAPKLKELGLLTELDLSSFRILCELYSQYIQIINKINKEGMTYEDAGGYVRPQPEMKIKPELEKRYLAYLQQFGMSPASRSRMEVNISKGKKNEYLDW